jgi:hypothetical protein
MSFHEERDLTSECWFEILAVFQDPKNNFNWIVEEWIRGARFTFRAKKFLERAISNCCCNLRGPLEGSKKCIFKKYFPKRLFDILAHSGIFQVFWYKSVVFLCNFSSFFHKIWFKGLENRTKRSFRHITPFTMGQNHKILANFFCLKLFNFYRKWLKWRQNQVKSMKAEISKFIFDLRNLWTPPTRKLHPRTSPFSYTMRILSLVW